MSQVNQVMLIMFDTKQNCNKFYEVILDASGDVIARYGRVGQTGMKKVYSGGTGKFNSLINSKKKKGYREAEVEGLSSQNNAPSVSKNNAIEVALKQIRYKDKESLELIKRVANANIHNIVGNSSVTYDKEDGLFKTPLGIIRKNAVLKAMSILDDIKVLVDKPNISASEESRLFDLNTEYFF